MSPAALPFPEPTIPADDLREVLLGYLDYFRSAVVARVGDLDEAAARSTSLPSGWSPLELANHLVHVERRWLVWGFEGRAVDDPWGDTRDERWVVAADLSVRAVVDALEAGAVETRRIVLSHALDEVGQPSERWAGEPPATLQRVLLHLLQEFARHVGHLDIVRELHDGETGE